MPTFPFNADRDSQGAEGAGDPWWEPVGTRTPYSVPSMSSALELADPGADSADRQVFPDRAGQQPSTSLPGAPGLTPMPGEPPPDRPAAPPPPAAEVGSQEVAQAAPAGDETSPPEQPDVPADPAEPNDTAESDDADVDTPAPDASSAVAIGAAQKRPPGLTARGAFLVILVPTVVACLIGFVVSGVVSVPPSAGWGLVLGTVVAAVMSPPRLGWTVVWLPPLVMLSVIAVLGQVTMLGAMPTLAREVAMIASNLTTSAPAQLISVVAAAGILLVRRRLSARRH